ncbi:MAG: diguanylate cyclase, partial [Candidatus Acidiferrum sp.]
FRIAKDLSERTVFLNSMIAHTPFGIVVQGRTGKVQLCNKAFSDLFLYNPSEIIGKDLQELVVPKERQGESQQWIAQVSAGQPVHKIGRRVRKDGQLIDVEIHIIPLVQEGQVQSGYVIYKDISDQIKASVAARKHEDEMNHWIGQLQLRTMQMTILNEMGGLLQCAENTEEAYAIVGTSARDLFQSAIGGALFIRDNAKQSLEMVSTWGSSAIGEQIVSPNECWSLRLGQPHWSECPGRSIVCAHVDRSTPANHLCVPILAQGEALGVLYLKFGPADETRDAEDKQRSEDSQKRLALTVASEIAMSLANLRLREKLREQSIRDPLTGLFNRRYMQESFDRELQRAKRKHRSLAVIFVDLDRFKRFNDVFGHEAGDKVLQSIADVFRMHFRSHDLIYRYGGEEFAIVLPEASTEDAMNRAEALRVAAKELELVHQGKRLDPLTLSIGVAGFPDHGDTVEELLEKADKSLYVSKSTGRDRVTLCNI